MLTKPVLQFVSYWAQPLVSCMSPAKVLLASTLATALCSVVLKINKEEGPSCGSSWEGEMLLQGAALLESWLPFDIILYSSQEGGALAPLPLTWWLPQEMLWLCSMFPAGKTI